MLQLLLQLLPVVAESAPPQITPISGQPIEHIVSAIDQLHRCGHAHGMDVPDIPARQYRNKATGVTHMVVGATQYHVTTGTDMFKLNRSCAYCVSFCQSKQCAQGDNKKKGCLLQGWLLSGGYVALIDTYQQGSHVKPSEVMRCKVIWVRLH